MSSVTRRNCFSFIFFSCLLVCLSRLQEGLSQEYNYDVELSPLLDREAIHQELLKRLAPEDVVLSVNSVKIEPTTPPPMVMEDMGHEIRQERDMCNKDHYWYVKGRRCIPLICLVGRQRRARRGECVCTLPYLGCMVLE